MVTSNKQPDKKVVKMVDQSNSVVVPQRTLLGEVNEHITCPLCRGYYIDATTIVECLHSFCRSCIIKHLQVKSYCPVCEMMINSAKPNIKLDKALQDIVYKLVPGLFQKEMERRQQFYASRPGPAASATPEQRGEDTERIIFSPEDVISFSLEYADATDSDSISSKSSDSNDPHPVPASTRRYLQCPAVVNISHLKKFLSMKFDIDSTQFAIDILYKRVPLPDYYTLMDIAYIYNWKRNEPMRFFYQIIDYVARRNRLFDLNRKGSHFRDRKPSPASTEDTNISSPAPNTIDQGSEGTSGTDSPMPEENTAKSTNENTISGDIVKEQNKLLPETSKDNSLSPSKSDEDVEKSQFLNSFELTAKSNCTTLKSSPGKSQDDDKTSTEDVSKTQTAVLEEKLNDGLKRKYQASASTELKKLKIELEKTKIPINLLGTSSPPKVPINTDTKNDHCMPKTKEMESMPVTNQTAASKIMGSTSATLKDSKLQSSALSTVKQQAPESPGIKRPVIPTQNVMSPKRKTSNEIPSSVNQPNQNVPIVQKTISPLKLHIPKLDVPQTAPKPADVQKANLKKIPDLKPSTPMQQSSMTLPSNKPPQVNKVRMDLLANNSDPTIDRSKILSQVNTSLGTPSPGPHGSGDPLKSLFDSCKINIPSSLSITLTDQKLDPRSLGEPTNIETKKNPINKNSVVGTGPSHKVPTPPVHNYIEILKLPDPDPKKLNKSDGNFETKLNPQNKIENVTPAKLPVKSSETSAKGPIPNLKPISDTKLGKQSGNFAAPITFQQTFEQQVQSMQGDKKPKLPKNKAQVPKLVPANAKSLSAANKLANSMSKPNTTSTTIDGKSSTALDLSSPHNVQNQGSQQTYDKKFETMQSIANLAKKQNVPSLSSPLNTPQCSVFSSMTNRIPPANNTNPMNIDKMIPSGSQMNNARPDMTNKINQLKPGNSASSTISTSPAYQNIHSSPSTPQSSMRQTRSPSSSPKLVIAEDKHATGSMEQIMNQSNQITSTQIPNLNASKTDIAKVGPGPSKPGMKPSKPVATGKMPGIWQPLTQTVKSSPTMNTPSPNDYLCHQIFARQRDAWIKAQRHYDLFKNMSPLAHQTQNDFNKDKQ